MAIGPGSFTGLRIGLSAAKGLCYSTGKPLVAVPTLEAFAWNFPHCAYPVCLMLDARKGEVYAAMFGWAEGKFCRLSPETPSRPEEFLAGVKGRVLLAGEGTLIYREKILEVLAERALFASSEKMVPSPANVGLLGLRKALAGDFLDPVAAVPLYLRRSEAELKWKEKS